ncbi:MAG: ABC transporter permease, partial [Odoribacter sp.]|nr:ABC transporter permease [Odoribacter sp.]
MNKTFIIIGREFTTRVRKKSFLVLTLVVPVLLTVFYAFLMWMLLKNDTQERRIAVINHSGLENPLDQINNTVFE